MHFSFIHTADIHLDSPFKGLINLPKSIRDKLIRSIERAFEELVSYAITEAVDFIVIAGDIYDQLHRSVRAQLFFHSCLTRLKQANIMVFMVHGNHDPLQNEATVVTLPKNTILFPADQVSSYIFEKNGEALAQVYGISYASKKEERRLASMYKVANQELFNIGILHTQVEGYSEHEAYAPSTQQELLAQHIDYWALGHVHQRQLLHEKPYIIYPGNLQGRHVKESGEKGFYHVHVSENKHVDCTFRPIRQVLWCDIELDITEIASISQVMDMLNDRMQHLLEQHTCSLMVQIKLHGTSQLSQYLMQSNEKGDLIEALNHYWAAGMGQHFVWIHALHYTGKPPVDLVKLRNQDTLLGEGLRVLDSWKLDDVMPEDVQGDIAELFSHHRARRYLTQPTADDWKIFLKQIEQRLLLVGTEVEHHED